MKKAAFVLALVLGMVFQTAWAENVNVIWMTSTSVFKHDAAIVALDNSSFYANGFDASATGQGTQGFSPWQASSDNGGALIADTSATNAEPALFIDGTCFGFWGEYYAITRPFVGILDGGQVASVAFQASRFPGSRCVRLVSPDGNTLFEYWNNDTSAGVNVADYSGEEVELGYGADLTGLVILSVSNAPDATALRVSLDFPEDDFTYFCNIDPSVATSWRSGIAGIQVAVYGSQYAQDFFVNNFRVVQEAASEVKDLSLSASTWAINDGQSNTVTFTLTRTDASEAATVDIDTSDSDFVDPSVRSVTFDVGETEKTFTAVAQLTGDECFATISAYAPGYAAASWNIKGPSFGFDTASDHVLPAESISAWVDLYANTGVIADTALVSVVSSDANVLGIGPDPIMWNQNENGSYYAELSLQGVSAGEATISLIYDGVVIWDDISVSVLPIGFELSGPDSARAGSTKPLFLKATLSYPEEQCTVSVSPAGAATVAPDSFDLSDPEEDGFYYQDLAVTFDEDAVGPVTIHVESPNYSADWTVNVVAPPVYSDYVAYDDAALYAGAFAPSSLGEGTEKFSAWTDVKTLATYGAVYVGTQDGGFPAILEDGASFGLYANGGDDPAYETYRPFVSDLAPGQKASVEFVASSAYGSRYIRFVREWEGVPYNRFEIWNVANGTVGVNIDGRDENDFHWSSTPRHIVVSVQRSVDGASYTLAVFSPESDELWQTVVDDTEGSWGDGIQGILFGAYDTSSDFIFNRMMIEQVEVPVPTIAISGVWDPDATGDYVFTVTASEPAIGNVSLGIEPDDPAIATLSAASLDFGEGETVKTFTLSLNALPEGEDPEWNSVSIVATPDDPSIESALFTIYPTSQWFSLEPTDDKSEPWIRDLNETNTTFEVHVWASRSYLGTVALASSDTSVLTVPASVEVTANGTTFVVTMVGPGQATVTATATDGTTADYGFTIVGEAPVKPVVPAPTFVDGALALDLSAIPKSWAYAVCTDLLADPQVWAPVENATVSESLLLVPLTNYPYAIFRAQSGLD